MVDGGFCPCSSGQQTIRRHCHGIEHHLIQLARGVDRRSGTRRQSWGAPWHREQREFARQPGRADHQIRYPGVRDESFSAVQHIAPGCVGGSVHADGLVPPRCALFQERQRGFALAFRNRGQVASFLRLAPGVVNHAGGQQRGGKIRPRQQRAAHFFQHRGHFHQAHSEAAVLLGNDNSHPALIGHLAPQAGIESRIGFHQPPYFGAGTFGRQKLPRGLL